MKIITFSKYFVENANQLSSNTGYKVVYALDAGGSYCVFSAHDAAAELLEFQYKYDTSYCIYQSENMDSQFFTPAYVELLTNKRNIVLQYSPLIALQCKERHNITTHAFFDFDYPKIERNFKRKIDVLFFGTITKKRHDILREIQNQFPKLEFYITSDLFHQQLEDTLLRTRFVLNISAYENNALETHRINKALACGCEVITNYSDDNTMNGRYVDKLIFCGRTVWDYIKAIKQYV
jgi:hypothetical protein